VPEAEDLLELAVAPEFVRGVEGAAVVPDEPLSLLMGQATEDAFWIERAMIVIEWFSRHDAPPQH
jgi:hypothetical protein